MITVVLAVGTLSSIPRYVDRVSQAGLRRAVGDATVQNSGLAVDVQDRIDVTPGIDAIVDLQSRGAQFRSALPSSVGAILGDDHVVADTPSMELVDAAGNPLYSSLLQYPRLRFRYQDDVWNHVELVEGRLPAKHPASTIGEAIANSSDVSPEVRDRQRPVFEFVATRATLNALRVTVGDRFLVLPTAGNTMPAGVLDVPRRLA